ncbi:MAG: hypothetical protein ACRDE2_09630 [Chitinophagaceae bacterium]
MFYVPGIGYQVSGIGDQVSSSRLHVPCSKVYYSGTILKLLWNHLGTILERP